MRILGKGTHSGGTPVRSNGESGGSSGVVDGIGNVRVWKNVFRMATAPEV